MPRLFRHGLIVSLLLACAVLGWRWRGARNAPDTPRAVAGATTGAAGEVGGRGETKAEPDATAALVRAENLRRLAYAQAWGDAEQPEALAAFRDWTGRYRAAAPAQRAGLEAEGEALARARRAVMLDLIKTEPQRALALTVPARVRAELPAAVLAQLETRVAGRGDYALLSGSTEAGAGAARVTARRIAYVGGTEYVAHAYGRRLNQLTKEGASLHGVALDGQLALHESPVRALEPGEAVEAAAEDLHCPVSGLAVAALAADTTVNQGALTVAAAFGRTWEFCGTDPDMLGSFDQQLAAAEDGTNPAVAPPGAPPRTAADAPTSRTTGPQRVLVIRADFSDVPGAAVSAAEAQTTMDTIVSPFYEAASYGATKLTTTVSTNVYRLPLTGAAYAVGGLNTQLHTDARTLAAADHTLANFDRIIVVFNRLTLLPNSQINYSGLGSVGGSSVWINGTFALRNVAHELGHTYGLEHANMWEVFDNNPVSPTGTSIEYNDPFDPMSSGNTDTRFDFSMWAKNRLGWLPDSAVLNVTASGTYRVFRYDHPGAAALNQPLALRVFRDGVHWYWIGLRQNFTTNASLTNGAYVTWGMASLQQTQLIGLTAPYYNGTAIPSLTTALGLAVGATFNDTAYGVAIRPLAKGGTDPAQYLDVQITVPATPPGVVAAWGEEGVLFRDTPEVETNVPLRMAGAIAIAPGDFHLLALKADGSVDGWGLNTSNQVTIPAGLKGNVASIAAGANVSAAVLTDGTVRLWGSNANGQLTVPAGLTNVRQLAIGRNHVLALKYDGTVVGWGNNASGQITVPVGLADVTSICAATSISVALKRDGTVVRWGVLATDIPFPANLTGVVAISALGALNGGQFAAALKSDGTVVAWGANNTNQLTVPASVKDIVAISAGAFHTLCLKADGTVVGFGSASGGKLSVPAVLPSVTGLAATNQASFALTGPRAITLTVQPQAAAIGAGGSATFVVAAVGSPALSYQWRKDGVAIVGATGPAYTVAAATVADGARYDVVVSDRLGAPSVTSAAAALSVAPPVNPTDVINPPRLINLSIVTSIAPGETGFAMGTVLGGAGTSGNKALLTRAAGPSLSAFGLTTGTLADPKMVLIGAGNVTVASNDDWGGDGTLRATFTQVGAFAYQADASKDAAIYRPALPAGNYSVSVSGAAGNTGTVLAEIYDATPANQFTAATPRLLNVSIIKNIGTSLTAGFVVGGSGPKKVLIRAVGPSLAAFGVGDLLADPKLELIRNIGTVSLGGNDNWGGDSDLVAAGNQVGAFALANVTSKDAALLATLAPGNYSVVVTGVGGTTGTALVEVYDVP